MAISNAAWDGSASNYADTNAYCSACLLDLNAPGEKKTQDNCKLPYKMPNGDINTNALSAAAGALNGARNSLTGVSPAAKKKAAKALIRAYQEAQLTPPDSLKNMAQ